MPISFSESNRVASRMVPIISICRILRPYSFKLRYRKKLTESNSIYSYSLRMKFCKKKENPQITSIVRFRSVCLHILYSSIRGTIFCSVDEMTRTIFENFLNCSVCYLSNSKIIDISKFFATG